MSDAARPRRPRRRQPGGDQRAAQRQGRQRPSAAHGGRERPAQRPSERAAAATRSGWPPTRHARRADGAYANLELPEVLRDKRHPRPGRRVRHRARLRRAAHARPLRPDHRRAPPAGRSPDRRQRPRHAAARRAPAARHARAAHAAVDETVGLARKVNGAGRGGLVNAVHAPGQRARPRRWLAEVVPTEPTRPPGWRSRTPPGVGGPGAAGGAGRPRRRHGRDGRRRARGPAGRGQRARQGLAGRPARSDRGRRAARRGRRGRRRSPRSVPCSPVATRAAYARCARDAPRSRTRAPSWSPSPSPPSPVDGRRTEQWLDLCAGPGGKAGLLAALALDRGADLTANEVSDHRTELVRQTLRPATPGAGGRPHLRCAPATAGASARTSPAATTGFSSTPRAPGWGPCAADRRPAGAAPRPTWPTSAQLQRELLASAIDATAPGGVVAYATCSPHLAETAFVVRRRDQAARRRRAARRPRVRARRRGTRSSVPGAGPTVQLWPHLHGTDGMFLALLRKRG